MAEIVCIECKSTVSDALAFCSECGFPFDSTIAEQQEIAVAGDAAETATDTDTDSAEEAVANDLVADAAEIVAGADAIADAVAEDQDAAHITAIPLLPDMLQQTLDSLMAEIGEIQRTLIDIRQGAASNATISDENTQRALSAIDLKLDELARLTSKKEAESKTIAVNEAKNTPNSLIDYTFYVAVVQIIFVVANLFLVAYIVTLVR